MFRTEINSTPSYQNINFKNEIITIGSCFSGNIGKRLQAHKIHTSINPFGVIYNPISIFKLLSHCIENKPIDESGFLERENHWFHFDIHSEINEGSKVELNEKINYSLKKTFSALQKASWLIITPGTAIVYQKLNSSQIVANCHKQPSQHFTKNMLSPEEIILGFKNIHELIKSINPDLKFIFTLSPVRHIKDTIQVNSVSKATLLLAINQLCYQFENVHYFPAYEIMLDDLRDYRFYDKDMLHPNEVAQDYIWNIFQKTYFDQETIEFIKQWGKLMKAMAHKPFHPHTASHQKFVGKLLNQLEGISKKVNVDNEIELVKSQLL